MKRNWAILRWMLFLVISQFVVIFIFFIIGPILNREHIYAQQVSVWSVVLTVVGELLVAVSLYLLIARRAAPEIRLIDRRLIRSTVSIMVPLLALLLFILLKFNPRLTFSSGLPLHTAFISKLVVFLIVAAYEEYMFRGVILTLLRRSMSLGKAVVVSSLVFAAFHWEEVISAILSLNMSVDSVILNIYISLLTVFLFGIVMAYSYLRTGQLIWPIIFHWISDFSPWGLYINALFHGYFPVIALYILVIIVSETSHLLQRFESI
ncbi:MAG: CPBP family intramembrane glutamic endopeptidase [Bacilli bacterium]